MNKIMLVATVTLLMAGLGTTPLSAVLVTGNMNIFGAGHPLPPLTGPPNAVGSEGIVPVLGANVVAGNSLTFAVSGSTNCGSTVGTPCNSVIGADGANLVPGGGTNINACCFNVGISGITFSDRMMFLAGVFVGATEPTGNGPTGLVYAPGGPADTGTSFSPLLYQTFFIGDGLTGFGNAAGAVQSFNAPTSATRLFLGFLDSFNNFVGFPGAYTDNDGPGLTVTVSGATGAVPEPGTVMLMSLGFLGIALLRKKLA